VSIPVIKPMSAPCDESDGSVGDAARRRVADRARIAEALVPSGIRPHCARGAIGGGK
jgi:hypothetical protein